MDVLKSNLNSLMVWDHCVSNTQTLHTLTMKRYVLEKTVADIGQ
uniref:Uncharacterized protein n=1 Tax=Rhizophora mucronata TaxID=61149 RepID=A0A2P2J417_RHIMU